MPDLQPQTSSGHSPHGAASLPTEPDDALSRLTKMSTTAGVGSGDYVAINTLAIASLILGFFSVFTPLLGSSLLQVIPLSAVVTALVAWRQIQRSNGTQKGKALAAAGIALALLIGGGTLVAKAVTALTYAPETSKICTIIEKLGNEIAGAGAATPAPSTQPASRPTTRSAEYIDRMIQVDRHYHTAYLMFSDKFRSRVSEQRFIEVWSQVNRSASGVESMEWNGHIDFTTDTGSGAPQAVVMAWMRLKDPNEVVREGMIFTKEAGVWEIDDVPNLFGEVKARKK
jgi:hypothetical protein